MKKIFLPSLLMLFFMQTAAYRIEFGNNISINQPVNEDLYIAGGTITINAAIRGDLIIAGGTIIINDTVSNDILLAGGTVTFNGFVGDDIRCAGGDLHISKKVAGDVVITGGKVVIDKEVTIGGLLVSGGDITLNGTVIGPVKGAFRLLAINGSIENDIDCRGGKITVNGSVAGKSILAAREIIIGNNASFNNDIRYWNKEGSLYFKQSIKNGRAIYDPSLRIRTGRWYYLGAATALGLLWYLGMALLMIMIIQYLFGITMKKAGNTVFNQSLKSLGFGFLFFIAVPVAAIIAFITLIGVPVGFLLLFGYLALFLLATVIAATVASHWVNNRAGYNWSYWKIVFASFGIFILFKLLTIAPFIGWLLMFLIVCMAFGSILLNINWKKKQAVMTTG
jgi:cytoskeletal protein CcmA (bactofilin family)